MGCITAEMKAKMLFLSYSHFDRLQFDLVFAVFDFLYDNTTV